MDLFRRGGNILISFALGLDQGFGDIQHCYQPSNSTGNGRKLAQEKNIVDWSID